MTISELQLETWAKAQSGEAAKRTHHAIRRALASADPPAGYMWKVYLQGSYKNTTNTRGNHDVDVVVELTSHDESSSWLEVRPFYSFVSGALKERFGRQNITERSKCIRVEGDGSRVDADVVVAMSYSEHLGGRRYKSGIRLFTGLLGDRLVNFPEAHFANGAAKNKATGGRFRRTVRMFKNARNAIGKKTWFPPAVPSYFLECLLYNVPDECFVKSHQETYVLATAWLAERFEADPDGSDFVSQNGLHDLFGSDSIHWNTRDARRCVEGFGHLWNNRTR